MSARDSDESSHGDLDGSGFEESVEAADGGAGRGGGSGGGGGGGGEHKRETSLRNDKYDMALEISASNDLSEAGAAGRGPGRKELVLRNDKFDEALDVSASMDMPSADFDGAKQLAGARPSGASGGHAGAERRGSAGGAGGKEKGGVMPVKNDQFDAALELSSNDGGSSIDTHSDDEHSPQKRSIAIPQSTSSAGITGRTGASVASAAGAGAGAGAAAGDGDVQAGADRSSLGSTGGSLGPPSNAAGAKGSAAKPGGGGLGGGNGLGGGAGVSGTGRSSLGASESGSGSEESSESEGESGADGAGGGGGGRGRSGMVKLEGAYNPDDYANLNVGADIKDLFHYIQRYKPHEVDLETSLKCFVPDYIPAVGDMDAFVKVPRPDGKTDDLGLKVLDEPAANQSDATVLELQLRAVSKRQHGDVAVRSIEDAAKNLTEIDRWIASIADLHRTKPPPQVHYKRSMPDIDTLMEVWPVELEDLLSGPGGAAAAFPPPSIELSLDEYCRLACVLLDVPVHDGAGGGGLIESLHLLFTLYMEFKANQHFQGGGPAAAFMGSSYK